MRGKLYYLIHWQGESKKKATWEEEDKLVEDGIGDMLDEYDENN